MKSIKNIKKNESGFTLIEMIVSLCIIAIFYLSVCMAMANGSKIYLEETISGNNKTVLQTVLDDMASYISSGTSPQIYYIVTKDEPEVNGFDTSSYLINASVDTGMVYIVTEPVNGTATEKVYLLMGNTKEDITKAVEDASLGIDFFDTFVGNGINLSTMTISLSEDKSRVEGLAYGVDYYQGMELELQITVSDKLDSAYEVVLIGKTATDTYEVTKVVKNLNQ